MPKSFNFILTNETGDRSYCTCLVFTEEADSRLQSKLIPVVKPGRDKIYVEKAICLIGNFPFLNNYKEYLREIYRMQVSNFSMKVSLEKQISHFCEAMYLDNDENNAVSYEIGNTELKFYKQPIQFQDYDYISATTHLPLLCLLDMKNVLEIFSNILLEGKILLISKSNNILSSVCISLTELIFPFKWPHVIIPVLPDKMRLFFTSAGSVYNREYKYK